jgi:hypothetical protein
MKNMTTITTSATPRYGIFFERRRGRTPELIGVIEKERAGEAPRGPDGSGCFGRVLGARLPSICFVTGFCVVLSSLWEESTVFEVELRACATLVGAAGGETLLVELRSFFYDEASD